MDGGWASQMSVARGWILPPSEGMRLPLLLMLQTLRICRKSSVVVAWQQGASVYANASHGRSSSRKRGRPSSAGGAPLGPAWGRSYYRRAFSTCTTASTRLSAEEIGDNAAAETQERKSSSRSPQVWRPKVAKVAILYDETQYEGKGSREGRSAVEGSEAALACALGVPCVSSAVIASSGPAALDLDFVLYFDADGALVVEQQESASGTSMGSPLAPLKVDFLGGKHAFRAVQRQKEMIVQAVTPSKSAAVGALPSDCLVWDMCGGLGRDAFVLATAGFRVAMTERSPIVVQLVRDALRRAVEGDNVGAKEAARRMSVGLGDSTCLAPHEEGYDYDGAMEMDEAGDEAELGEDEGGSRSRSSSSANSSKSSSSASSGGGHVFAAVVGPQERPHVAYLDPMFATKKKSSALVKKDMQLLQRIAATITSGRGENSRPIGGVGAEMESSDESSSSSSSSSSSRRRKKSKSKNSSAASDGSSKEEVRLFEKAMSVATVKVVVKRPIKGPPIVPHPPPSHSLKGKSLRFDVYPVPRGGGIYDWGRG